MFTHEFLFALEIFESKTHIKQNHTFMQRTKLEIILFEDLLGARMTINKNESGAVCKGTCAEIETD